MGRFRRVGSRFSRSRRCRYLVLLILSVQLFAVMPGAVGVSSAMLLGGPAESRASTSTQYSSPIWFPLRRTISGGEIKIGCTYLSHGTKGGYDCNGHHPFWALDLLAGSGTDIYAAGAGFARNVTGQAGFSGYGKTVVVDHGNNLMSLYAHMSVVMVGSKGAWVDQDTMIGKVGETGDATVPHLHFEITSSGDFGSGSRDPGPLKACHGSQLVAYPQAWGLTTWKGIPWGTQTGFSDGTGCATANPVPDLVTEVQKEATILVPEPAKQRSTGFMGLRGTRVTYSARLTSSPGSTALINATVAFRADGRPLCSAVTDATGTAQCHVSYPLFRGPSGRSIFHVTFDGNASFLSSTAVGSIH